MASGVGARDRRAHACDGRVPDRADHAGRALDVLEERTSRRSADSTPAETSSLSTGAVTSESHVRADRHLRFVHAWREPLRTPAFVGRRREARRWIDPRTGEVREEEAPRRPGLSPSNGFSATQEAHFPSGSWAPSRGAGASSSLSPGNARRLPISPHSGGGLRRPCRDRPHQARRRARGAGPARSGRVSPGLARCFQAAPDGAWGLTFGPHVESDGEMVTTSGASRARSRKSLASRPLRGWRRLVPSSCSSWPDRRAQRWLGHAQPLSRA
jgi:hypothetical protein